MAIKNFGQYQQILAACLQLCRGQVPEPWMAVGQSTGAAVMVEYLFRHRYTAETSPFEHWILLAPLVRPFGWRSAIVLHTLLGPFLRTWKRAFMPNSHDSEFVRFLKDKDPLQSRTVSIDWVSALRRWIREIEATEPLDMPVTIVQGQDDTTVDWQHNIPQLQKLLPQAQVHFIKEARHQLVNESATIRQQVFQWVSEALNQAADRVKSSS